MNPSVLVRFQYYLDFVFSYYLADILKISVEAVSKLFDDSILAIFPKVLSEASIVFSKMAKQTKEKGL